MKVEPLYNGRQKFLVSLKMRNLLFYFSVNYKDNVVTVITFRYYVISY